MDFVEHYNAATHTAPQRTAAAISVWLSGERYRLATRYRFACFSLTDVYTNAVPVGCNAPGTRFVHRFDIRLRLDYAATRVPST